MRYSTLLQEMQTFKRGHMPNNFAYINRIFLDNCYYKLQQNHDELKHRRLTIYDDRLYFYNLDADYSTIQKYRIELPKTCIIQEKLNSDNDIIKFVDTYCKKGILLHIFNENNKLIGHYKQQIYLDYMASENIKKNKM